MKLPKDHPSHHPLWKNNDAYNAFRKTLRCFWDATPYKHRRFEEWRLSEYWYNILQDCLKD